MDSKHEIIKKLLVNKVVFAILIIVSFLVFAFFADQRSQNLSIYFLDVGQGDAVLIRTPDMKYMLVDAGPDDEILAELGKILPVWRQKIHVVLATHPDLDHVGGLPEVIEKYDVDQVFAVELEEGNVAYSEFLKRVHERGIPIDDLREEDDFVLGCCTEIDVLWPDSKVDYESIDDKNDLSVTFKLEYKKFDAFFGGDLKSELEDVVIRRDPIDVEVLKVGHHGSLTSTSEEFLNRLKPEIAVISAGENNRYGHPKEEILERLEQRSVITLQTKNNGTIRIETDGEEWMWF